MLLTATYSESPNPHLNPPYRQAFEGNTLSLGSDDEVPEKHPSNPRFNKKSHWRSVINLAVFTMGVITFANLLLFVTVLGKHGWGNSTQLLQEGKCKTVKISSTIWHLMINVASTMLLGSSNFIMQCLTAPTRKDVDWAHEKRKFLEIGV
ncbi:hypothetical protein EX30DRAFT_39561 [Ascodesmis nigricans]|uniref:DUF6536 domain-containing protein n=1 Tax=Ascodesmis nigricans TaxID=341454 RepID=A0A4S2MW37_9PEZI|nr:hypothetical protein EX30DRAFT_39561 [Ascodesmis nigricans]